MHLYNSSMLHCRQNPSQVLSELNKCPSRPQKLFLYSDPEFYTKHKRIRLQLTTRSFAKFYKEFSKYTAHSDFNNKAIKCYLRDSLSKNLSCQLVSINLKDFIYYQLGQEYQTHDNKLCAASINICKII